MTLQVTSRGCMQHPVPFCKVSCFLVIFCIYTHCGVYDNKISKEIYWLYLIDRHCLIQYFENKRQIWTPLNNHLHNLSLCSLSILTLTTYTDHTGLDAIKPVFGISEKVRLKPVSSVTETSYKIENWLVASLDMIPSNKQITKALIRLRICAGWSAPLLFTNPQR